MPIPNRLPSRRLKRIFRFSFLFLFTVSWSYRPAFSKEIWIPVQTRASWAPDESWGPHFGKGQSRFASTWFGRPYLSMGDSLFSGDSTGEVWTAIAYQKRYMYGIPTPLSIGSGGKVAWGNLIRSDSGEPWISPTGMYRNPTALRISGEKNILYGNGYETIALSTDGGQTSSIKFVGGGYGSIVSMLGGLFGGWEFAATQGRGIVVSRDHGSNWTTLNSIASSFTDMDCATHLSGEYLNFEQRPYQQIVWGINRYSSGTPILLKILPGYSEIDSANVHCQEISGISSAIVSAFAVNHYWRTWDYKYPSLVWLGTWGQGLFVSKDEGKTWVADNEGLNSLFVEDIWISTRGTALVLTKGGLFRKAETNPTSVKSRIQTAKKVSPESIFPGTRMLRSKSGKPYTIDGRGILIR